MRTKNREDGDSLTGEFRNGYHIARRNYAVVPPSVLYDPFLSAAAKGLWAYLQSQPDGVEISISEIAKDFSDPKEVIEEAFEELIIFGYIDRIPVMDDEGIVEYNYCLKEVASRRER